MSELLQLQFKFFELSLRLGAHVREVGFVAKWGECARTDEQAEINAIGEDGRERVAAAVGRLGFAMLAEKLRNNGKAGGIRNSVHQISLAADLHLFSPDGRVYYSDSAHHAPLGKWWKEQNPLCRWGGDWGDGNHYSLEYQGRK